MATTDPSYLSRLPTTTLLSLLDTLPDTDVLHICTSTPRLQQICSKPELFADLLKSLYGLDREIFLFNSGESRDYPSGESRESTESTIKRYLQYRRVLRKCKNTPIDCLQNAIQERVPDLVRYHLRLLGGRPELGLKIAARTDNIEAINSFLQLVEKIPYERRVRIYIEAINEALIANQPRTFFHLLDIVEPDLSADEYEMILLTAFYRAGYTHDFTFLQQLADRSLTLSGALDRAIAGAVDGGLVDADEIIAEFFMNV